MQIAEYSERVGIIQDYEDLRTSKIAVHRWPEILILLMALGLADFRGSKRVLTGLTWSRLFSRWEFAHDFRTGTATGGVLLVARL